MKQPLTLTEQVQCIKSHGFLVDNEQQLKITLSKINYYRLRGYWLTFETNDQIIDNTNFHSVIDAYNFDSELRRWLLSAIEPIEIKLRTQFAYVLAHSHDADALSNAELFTNSNAFNKCSQSLNREIERAEKSKNPFVLHNLEKFGELPVWVSVELMSFGTLSRFFGILQPNLQSAIAKEFGVNKKYLVSWFHHLSTVRNICAHYSRFYNRIMTIKPKLLKRHKHLDSLKEFSTFIIIKELTDIEEWDNYFHELNNIIAHYKNVSLRPMGFPKNWEQVLNDEGKE
jgi:abortive infection bacteriophage resistance protein